MQIQVYIFVGLLESGKTSFIKEVLSTPSFNDGGYTLLIRCEDGDEEFDEAFLIANNVTLAEVEEEGQLTPEAMRRAADVAKPDRVIIELNGMWDLAKLVNETLPEEWELYQTVACINGATFPLYSANLGQKMFEHITNADLIVFNRCTQEDKDYLHERNIRAMNPRASIFLDDLDGNTEDYRDNMVLPFDVEADSITIADADYGLFYVDASGDPQKYNGKTVRFKAHVLVSSQLPTGWMVPGRHGMVCCADDITFLGFACNAGEHLSAMENKGWYTITAGIHVEELPQYKGEGPVLTLLEMEKAAPPDDEIVYFS